MSNHHDKANNYWEEQLQRESLAEPSLKSKIHWIKPLTVFHALEFRGLDKRDHYEAPNYDAWDHMAWNNPSQNRFDKKCADYSIDLRKCQHYLKTEFPILKTSFIERRNYCWKMHDNFSNCKRNYIRKNKKFVNDTAIFPEDH